MNIPSSGSHHRRGVTALQGTAPHCRRGVTAPHRRTPHRLELFLAEATRRNRGRRPRWACLVDELRSGPKTTGELGYVRGIGENVRGIRREADRNLRRIDFSIESAETEQRDAAGEPIPNATYRLVDQQLQRHLDRTAEEVRRRKEQLGLGV